MKVEEALRLLDQHHEMFYGVADMARKTGHPVPIDSRGFSQLLISLLCGIGGLARRKGPDFEDGSDVKAANTWEAIDTPRFNNVIKAGTKAPTAGKIESLDAVPYLFLVLWDIAPNRGHPRCRIWCVRPQQDTLFRKMCETWYRQRDEGKIASNNFQLHPPRGEDSNIIRNTCGNLEYPLLFCAERVGDRYKLLTYNPKVLTEGLCKKPSDTER